MNTVATKKEFTPSPYQARIFQDITEREIHSIVVSAVPGSGKTETMKRMLQYIPAGASVLSLAFNSDAAAQLGDRIGVMLQEMVKEGRQVPSVTSLTIHKLGNATLKRHNMSRKTDRFKYSKLVKNYLQSRNVFDKNFTDSVTKLVDMTRLTLSGVTLNTNLRGDVTGVNFNDEELYKVVVRFDIDLDMNGEVETGSGEMLPAWNLALNALSEALKAGVSQSRLEGIVDFTDMIWLPVILKIAPAKYDYVLVDEAQDLSPCQRALVLASRANNGYFVAVGDRNQAIYGFAGASLRSLDEIIEATGAVERPLSICYRCPSSVIDMAAAIYPGIEAAPTAQAGVTQFITSDHVETMVQPGDLILSRVTAPLVSLCLQLLREGKRANVRGKDLGATFIGLLDKINKYENGALERRFNELTKFTANYKQHQITIIEQSGNEEDNESKIDSLNDKIDTLHALYSAYMTYFKDPAASGNFRKIINNQYSASYEGFKKAVEIFFQEDKEAQIILSTGHRAKGLEYPRVFILGYDQIPHPRAKSYDAIVQEMNLKYVMTTRAQKELYLCVALLPSEIEETTIEVVEDEDKDDFDEIGIMLGAIQIEVPQVEATPIVEEQAKPVIEAPKKRGRKATGRTRPKYQGTFDASIIKFLDSLKEQGIDKNRFIEECLMKSAEYQNWSEAQGEETPEPDNDPDNGGAPTPEEEQEQVQTEAEQSAPASWGGYDETVDALYKASTIHNGATLGEWNGVLSTENAPSMEPLTRDKLASNNGTTRLKDINQSRILALSNQSNDGLTLTRRERLR